jgi:methylase of polypeptide subunit release factors
MKRQPLIHPRVFDDEKWALSYAKRHAKLGRSVGRKYAKLLASRGFKGGKILDSGCGSGAILLELALAFEKVEGHGVDLSKYLINMQRTLQKKEDCLFAYHLKKLMWNHFPLRTIPLMWL